MVNIGDQGKNLENLLQIKNNLERAEQRITISIADKVFVLNELAKSYRPNEAFKEYFSNPIDEKINGNISYPVEIKMLVKKNGDYGHIMIEDNCGGMNRETINQKLEKIGESVKRGNAKTIGDKGLGLQAFRRFAEKMYIISKKENNPYYHFAEITKNYADAKTQIYTEQELKKRGDICLGSAMPFDEGRGTRIVLTGITEKDIKDFFTPQKLNDFLAEQYAPLLLNDDIAIKLGYAGGKTKPLEVSPRTPIGEQILAERIELSKNIFLECNIFNNLNGVSDKVNFYCQGAKIEPLTAINEFAGPWNSGKLNGIINTNYKSITGASRNMIILNSRDPVCMKIAETIHGWEKEITRKMGENEKHYRCDVLDKVMSNLLDTLAPIAKNVLSRKTLIKSKKSQLEDIVVETGDPAGKLPHGDGQDIKSDGKEHEVKRDLRGKKEKIIEGWKGYSRPNYTFQEFEADKRTLRSYYNSHTKTIVINESHDDFKKEVGKNYLSDKANDYLLLLICRELAGAEFQRLCSEKEFDPEFINELAHNTSEIETEMYVSTRRALKSRK